MFIRVGAVPVHHCGPAPDNGIIFNHFVIQSLLVFPTDLHPHVGTQAFLFNYSMISHFILALLLS